jgi:hypothetical protein
VQRGLWRPKKCSDSCGGVCKLSSYTVDPVTRKARHRGTCDVLVQGLMGLGVGAIQVMGRKKYRRPSLGGRDLTSSSTFAGVEAGLCLCNATYVSPTCCGSIDGVVWEESQDLR